MKLRDLDRSSRNPTSFFPALHIFRSRFRNRETSRHSRKSYESVLRSSSALCCLTPLQSATVVPVLGVLRRPRHPGSPVTFPIRARRRHRNFHKCTCHRPASLYLLIFEQNNRKVYREVLIAGDLSKQDVRQAGTRGWFYLSGETASETIQLTYGNDTVYFAQPILSQFVPGGSGAGTFNQSSSIGLKDTTNNNFALTGRNVTKTNAGVVLRYAPPAH